MAQQRPHGSLYATAAFFGPSSIAEVRSVPFLHLAAMILSTATEFEPSPDPSHRTRSLGPVALARTVRRSGLSSPTVGLERPTYERFHRTPLGRRIDPKDHESHDRGSGPFHGRAKTNYCHPKPASPHFSPPGYYRRNGQPSLIAMLDAHQLAGRRAGGSQRADIDPFLGDAASVAYFPATSDVRILGAVNCP
jgi:hypothetical protein